MMYADRLFNALERNEPSAGQLLISAPGSTSPLFNRTVILIVDHSDVSSFGVVLTSRSDVAVFNVLPDWLPVVAKPQALYIGGPLNQQSVVGLAMTKTGVDIDAHPQLNRLAPRLAHVDMRADPEDLANYVDGLRLFAGYAEWGAGQLHKEIERGDWFVTPALPQDVITPGPADLWGDVMRRQDMPLPLYATFPEDLDSN